MNETTKLQNSICVICERHPGSYGRPLCQSCLTAGPREAAQHKRRIAEEIRSRDVEQLIKGFELEFGVSDFEFTEELVTKYREENKNEGELYEQIATWFQQLSNNDWIWFLATTMKPFVVTKFHHS